MIAFFLLDLLIRRTSWKNNTKDEKISLIINFITIPIYFLLGSVGVLFGIVDCSAQTELGKMLFDISVVMGSFTGITVIIVSVISIILRKQGRVRASKWVHIGSLAYIMLFAGIYNLSSIF
jgi:hypothetical protein